MITNHLKEVRSHIVWPDIQIIRDNSIAGSVTRLNNNIAELVSSNESNITSDAFQLDVSDNNNESPGESFSEEYPFLARCVRTRIEVDGTRRTKPAVSIFSDHLAVE